MTLEVRRIVTGHNEFGMGIIVSDEKLSAVSRGLGANISGCEIWSTNSMPSTTRWKRKPRNEPALSRNTIMSAAARAPRYG